MPTFRKKEKLVEAHQYVSKATAPNGVAFDDDGNPYVITDANVKVPVHPGDWILPEPDGIHHYPCTPQVFALNYVPHIEQTQKTITMEDIARHFYIKGGSQLRHDKFPAEWAAFCKEIGYTP